MQTDSADERTDVKATDGRVTNGRVPTILTDEEHLAFNEAYAVVLYPDRGIALIHDRRDRKARLTFTEFKRKHGVRGEQWLASNSRHLFTSPEQYWAIQMELGLQRELDAPGKNNYRVEGERP